MFEHFTFGAQSQLPSQLDLDISPSPTDTSFPSPITPPPTSFPSRTETQIVKAERGIDDLTCKLEEQSLSRHGLVRQFATWSCTTSPSTVQHSGLQIDTTIEIAHTSSVPTTPIDNPSVARGGIVSRRLKRQLNTQLQCERSHVRDINTLVSEMITSSSQCRLRKSPSSNFSLSSMIRDRELVLDTTEIDGMGPDDDEGFCEMDMDASRDVEETTMRRASTPSGIRKGYNMTSVKWARSADVVCVNGKIKVKNVPRMRKRKVLPVPE